VGGARCKHGSYYGGGVWQLQRNCKVGPSFLGGDQRLTAGAVAQARRPSEAGGQLCHHVQGSLLPGGSAGWGECER